MVDAALRHHPERGSAASSPSRPARRYATSKLRGERAENDDRTLGGMVTVPGIRDAHAGRWWRAIGGIALAARPGIRRGQTCPTPSDDGGMTTTRARS